MAVYNWSQTASANATADPTQNWAEGMAPSAVNDSARALLASAAKWRDDISGALVTGGSSTAYTVASNSNFDTLAHLANQMVAFSPHATNAATVTLNVDGLGAKPLRTSPNTELLAGTIIQGTPYVAVYNNSDGAFYLQGFVGNPYNIPLGAGMDYWLPTAPNSSFVFPVGQAINRVTYATLFAAMGTTYGTGDGSTTFNLPDKTGRISAMQEASATRLTSTYFGGNSTVLGAVGGGESHAITLTETPTGITSHGSNNITVFLAPGIGVPATSGAISGGAAGPSGTQSVPIQSGGTAWNSPINQMSNANQAIAVTSDNTGGQPHRTVQPTIVCNYILRII